MQTFNYHTHTYRCGHADLNLKDEEYVEEFIKMGFHKIAFTDHCPQKNKIDVRNNIRMQYSQRKEDLESIRQLKEKYKGKIQIESGYEVEYLPGEEDNIRELKQETDKLILGQHFIYDDNKELKILNSRITFSDEEIIRYAEYIETASSLGIPDVIAHPDIYMLSRRNFGEPEKIVANMIGKTAEKYNIPLEINLCRIFNKTYFENKQLNHQPIEEQRKKLINVEYPYRDFWEIVAQYKVTVLYGVDAHFKEQIQQYQELVQLANEIIGEETIEKLKFIETDKKEKFT